MNTLRKITFVMSVLVGTIAVTHAQNAYVNVDVGYNLAGASSFLGTNSTASNEEIVKGSFGKGISFGLGVGYMFGEHVGAEISFSYLSGSKYKFTDNDGSFSSTTEAKGKMIRITPALKVTGGEKLKPYAKFGVVIGVAPKIQVESSGGTGFGTTFTEEDEYSGGASIGFLGAAGVDFELSDKLAIFLELNSVVQSWAPQKNEWKYTESGGSVSVSESGTINYEDNVPIPNDNENLELKNYQPFSSFGIHAGVVLSFGGN